MGELVDVQPAGGHVGRDEEIGATSAQPAHHPVALLLAQPAVQRLGMVPAPVHRLGEPVDLLAGPAEHDRGRGRLDIQYPCERGRLVRPRDEVCALAHQRDLARRRRLVSDLDTDRVVHVAARQPVDARWHRRGEQHRLAVFGSLLQDRLDVLGEPHVQHLVGLVEHDRLQAAQP